MPDNSPGVYLKSSEGYRTFVPKSLPPEPSLRYDEETLTLLSNASIKLARLDGIATVLPDIELFMDMYLKKEAVLSSQIEGTQTSLTEVLTFESYPSKKGAFREQKEVINYVRAIYYGLDNIGDNLSIELIKTIHKMLLRDTRGEERKPGEFRERQTWIGGEGSSIFEAIYIPPPPDKIKQLMDEFVRFINLEDDIPHLIRASLLHYQFETIHPFFDGNGRIGRMLITLYLLWKKLILRPVLFLSIYLKRYRGEYYDWLMRVRLDGEWEGWVKFFLKGISQVSDEVLETAHDIIKLKEEIIKRLFIGSISSIYSVKLVDFMFQSPVFDIKSAAKKLKTTHQTINELITIFEEMGIVEEITGKQRYRIFKFVDYVKIIERGTSV